MRIPKIQIVRHRERYRTRASQIARGFRHRNSSTLAGIEFAIKRVAIGSGCKIFIRFAHQKHSSIRARAHHATKPHHVIVLTIHPLLGSDRGVSQQSQKRSFRIALRDGVGIQRLGQHDLSGFPVIHWCIVGKFAGRNFRNDFAVVLHSHHAIVFHHADFRVRQIPFLKNIAHDLLLTFVHDDQHPLLRFA